ncbi:EF-hand domain-containing protein [Prosthecobacter sp.]|uniref:EF-hand domain-containing protein n=1 Tax=Prosthecobacter sp. TaxID=1965333 RepID=UPI001DA0A413|nr:EF-hand domain-containing protein [Prosthecobacter sp.]MCB1275651.1 EF-hand domain-containing protein [Prosthecobacter sp.]
MKLKKSLIYGFGLLCLTCSASAQDGERKGPPEGGRPGGPPPGGGDPAARLAEFIKRADTDGDGKISKAEFEGMGKKESEERFSRMDANSDGFVDQDEIGKISQMIRRGAEGQGQGMRRPEGGPPGGEGGGFRRPPGGEGSRPEGGPRPDGAGRPDGERPRGEGMRPGGEGGPRGGGMFGGDPKESFKRMDTDGNGSVSEEEYIAATEKMREMFRNRGGQPGQPGQGGGRRPEGGPPGGEGGFRRPPSEGDAPKAPEGDKPKDAA